MPSAPRLSLWLFVCLAACGESGTSTLSISAARELDDGAEVTVKGHVSVVPDSFTSATSEHGFAIADGDAGIYVKMDAAPSLALGQAVEVTGVLGQMAKMRVVTAAPSGIVPTEEVMLVTATKVPTGDVDEAVEGRLVEVTASVTRTFVDDSPYGYKLWVDDGTGEVQIFVHTSADLEAATLMALPAGQGLVITGLAFQYEDLYEIAPRSLADLELL